MFSKRSNWKLEENAYTQALRRHRQSGRPVLDLTASNPTTCGFRYDEASILLALKSPAAMHYDPDPKGILPARQAIVDYYRQMNSAAAPDSERVILTTGTSEAYSFLFRLLCEPGDEVVIAQPSYPLFDFLAAIQDVKLRPTRFVYDHGWQIDFHALEQAIGPRTRAILLVHPNNPTGNFVGEQESERLQLLCRERNLALIVDEVFLDYKLAAVTPRKKPHGSFAFDNLTLTFVLSGLSKISALPQMKLGWIATSGPDALVRDAIARLEVISDTYLSLSAPMQHALPTLLRQRENMQPQLLERIATNLAQLDTHLTQQTLVTRLDIEGGWYAVLRVPAVQSDEDLAIRLLENHSVLVQPGHFYEFEDDGYLIVSLLTPAEEFAEGIRRTLACVAGR
jgi:alanine-synthesizing transaminase